MKECIPHTVKGELLPRRTCRIYRHSLIKMMLTKLLAKGQLMLLEAHLNGLEEKNRRRIETQAKQNQLALNSVMKILK